MTYNGTLALEFEVETCANCGMHFAVPLQYQKDRRRDHKSFYCPNGHSQHYSADNKVEKLNKQLKFVEKEHEQCMTNLVEQVEERDNEIEYLNRSRGYYKGKLTQAQED